VKTTTSPARRIEYVPLDDVATAERNAREHDLPKLVGSIRTFGFTIPLLPDDRTGRLVAGHGRLAALQRMRADGEPPPDGVDAADGEWRVPVIRGWASRDDDHAKAVSVADNRLSEIGGWDDGTLAELLEEIVDIDPTLLDVTGFTTDDLDKLLRDLGTYADRTSGYFGDPNSDTGEGEGEDGERSDDDDGANSDDSPAEYVQVSWVVSIDQRKTIRKALARAQNALDLNTSAVALCAVAEHFLAAHPE
jgi:hypothetical protein